MSWRIGQSWMNVPLKPTANFFARNIQCNGKEANLHKGPGISHKLKDTCSWLRPGCCLLENSRSLSAIENFRSVDGLTQLAKQASARLWCQNKWQFWTLWSIRAAIWAFRHSRTTWMTTSRPVPCAAIFGLCSPPNSHSSQHLV